MTLKVGIINIPWNIAKRFKPLEGIEFSKKDQNRMKSVKGMIANKKRRMHIPFGLITDELDYFENKYLNKDKE